MTQSLEQKIIAALADANITTVTLNELLDATENGIEEAKRDAARQRELAFDPVLSPDPKAAREALDDSAILVGRLQTLQTRLERRLATAIAAEQHASWLKDYNEVMAKRDAAAEEFKEYPELVNQLLDLLHTARQVDVECDRVNGEAPQGEPRRLLGVELTARNLKIFSISQPKISDRIALPDAQGDRMLWPPPQLNPTVFAPHPPNPHFSADWGLIREQQEQQVREQAVRDGEEREQSAIEAQRQSGAPVWWRPGEAAE
jgi:hypothetical protein